MKISVDDFDDIIFENRNQDYGAYELRANYPKRGSISMLISILIALISVLSPLIINILKQNEYNRYLEKNSSAELANLKEINQDEIAPPPPPPPPPNVKEIKFVAPKIVDTLTNDEVELATTEDLSENSNSGTVDTISKVVEVIVEETAPLVEQVYENFAIQEKPEFPGGAQAMIQYVASNTKYPSMALENGIEGTIYIKFVVTKNGDIGDPKVLRRVDPLLEEEALRVVKGMPKWIPGKNNGTPVNSWVVIPVKFSLGT